MWNLKEKVDYNKDLATDDAKEILILIQKTKIFGMKIVIYQQKVLLMRHLQFGLYQIILKNFIHLQKNPRLT